MEITPYKDSILLVIDSNDVNFTYKRDDTTSQTKFVDKRRGRGQTDHVSFPLTYSFLD